MAAKINQAFPDANVELIRGGKGAFIVMVDGTNKIWDKRAMNDEFPKEDQIIAKLKG